MSFEAIPLEEVWLSSIRALGLDEDTVTPESPEAVAASLRRAASFLCPTTPRAIVDTVLEVLTPVLPIPPAREDLMALLDQLISTGDLLELAETTPEGTTRLLYLGPPSFVEKFPGRYLLTGIRPLGAQLVGTDLNIDYESHLRTVSLDPGDAEAVFHAAGLHKIGVNHWAGLPSSQAPGEHLGDYVQRLDVARASGAVDGLTIIDPAKNPRYYSGRWRPPATGDTGDFVARRPQSYGADIWCVVRLADGTPERLVDLPLDYDSVTPGRDAAWRLQAAIDAVRGTPAVFRARRCLGMDPVEHVADFFSPMPTWAQRCLELVGMPIDRSAGALFSYRVPDAALMQLTSRLAGTLWMNVTTDEDE
jgi:hypothetical protein